jgi:hypothetical protein
MTATRAAVAAVVTAVTALMLTGCTGTPAAAPSTASEPQDSPAAQQPVASPAPSVASSSSSAVSAAPDLLLEDLSSAAGRDLSVGPALAAGTASDARVSRDGLWASLRVDTPSDGMLVVLHRTEGAWQVADAGSAGAGCPVAPPVALTDLGIDCGQ